MTLKEKANLKNALNNAWKLFHLAQDELIEKHDGIDEIPKNDKLVLNNFVSAVGKVFID